MMTMEAVYSAMRDLTLSQEERFIVEWQFRLLGDFNTALIRAIAQADEHNLARLSLVFPTECAAFLDWTRGDMATRLRAQGIDI